MCSFVRNLGKTENKYKNRFQKIVIKKAVFHQAD